MTVLRDAQTPSTSVDPELDGERPKRAADPYGFSLRAKLGMAAAAIAFGAICLLIAFGGGVDDESAGNAASDVAAPPLAIVDEPVETTDDAVAAPVVESDTDDASAPASVGSTDSSSADEATTAESTTIDDEPEAAEADSTGSETDSDPAVEPVVTRLGQPPADLELPPAPPGAPDRHALLSGGMVFLRGTVPTIEIEAQIVRSLVPIMGSGNVISEFTIDPDEPFDPNADNPVYNDEKVLFETRSAEIAPAFYPLLATAPILLELQPTVIITMYGHTDSDGFAQDNLVLSQQRVDAARDWIIAQGGDPERVIAIGVGETEPVADNATEEGRAENRRVETVISGFDFTLGG